MKLILPPIFCLLCIASLWGQKHAFGINVGTQFATYKETPISHEEAEFSFLGFNNYLSLNVPRIHAGLFYRHLLTEKIALEVAPSIFQERYRNLYRTVVDSINIASQNDFRGILLYVPVVFRFDLGHQLFLSAGGGSNLYLLKFKALPETPSQNGRIIEDYEKKIFEEVFNNINSWPINAEVGLSYGFGRISINGKFVYRINSIYDSVTLGGKKFALDFRTNYLQIELSCQLGKIKKNKTS